MTGYDKKTLEISASADVDVTVEVDLTGDGKWASYAVIDLKAEEDITHDFPDAFSAYWIRFTTNKDCKATAYLTYE
ncbi:MAG: hypothetical protein R3242_10700 [Akkermansiaceae bacterium]|nr:hypothetical protein [Akkermansiaceae bacterium]